MQRGRPRVIPTRVVMEQAGLSLSAVDYALVVLFFLPLAYLSIGNVFLFIAMRQRGSRIRSLFAGMAFLLYFGEGPGVRSKGLDVFAISLVLAAITTVLAALLLYPSIWGPLRAATSQV